MAFNLNAAAGKPAIPPGVGKERRNKAFGNSGHQRHGGREPPRCRGSRSFGGSVPRYWLQAASCLLIPDSTQWTQNTINNSPPTLQEICPNQVLMAR